jgi:hypothetical protein
MKATLRGLTTTLALLCALPALNVEAQPRRQFAQVEDLKGTDETETFEPTRKREKTSRKRATQEEKPSDWYLRIQQLPVLGMAVVSDNGVIDVELMKSINKNFHVGPTAVYHFGKVDSKKMQSFNLGVRSDLILGEFGHLSDIYLSTAIFVGYYKSATTESGIDIYENTFNKCSSKSEGWHRVGAMAVGKIWQLSEDVHVTTGLGAVKTKTMGSTSTRGNCPVPAEDDTGVTLPWFDFGVGFKI